MTRIRYDADGRKPFDNTDRKPLAPARPLTLKEYAEQVYVHRSLTFVPAEIRRQFEAEIERLDGAPLPRGYNQHPIYITAVYLASLNRRAQNVARHSKSA